MTHSGINRPWTGLPPVSRGFMLTNTASGKTRLFVFEEWLRLQGIIVHFTSQWELLHFEASAGHGIIYFNIKNQLTWNDVAFQAWKDFRSSSPCSIHTKEPKAKLSYFARSHLINELAIRDGENCVVCGQALLDDVTLEHLFDRAFGGNDSPSNLTLAHQACNNEVSTCRTLREKIEFIIQKRKSHGGL